MNQDRNHQCADGYHVQLGEPTSLTPRQAPGRVTRKARAFRAEIVRLRTLGYTLEAIRQALAEAGLLVSRSTVRREALRLDSHSPSLAIAQPRNRAGAPAPAPVLTPASTPPDQTTLCSGKEIAEAFVRTQSTNPLIRAKEHP